ncbi:hypothetical protein GCM10009629_58040 [Pseudonocardia alni]
MTFSDGGLALRRLGERYPDMSASARHLFAAMAVSVGKDDPACFMSHESLSTRTGQSVSTVQRALRELERAGVIARAGFAGPRLRRTVRWHMTELVALRAARPADDSSSVTMTDESRSVTMTDKRPVTMTDKRPVTMTDNPSDLSRPPGSDRGGRSDAATAAPSAGATGPAAAPSTGAGLDAEVAEGLGVSLAAARQQIDKWCAGRNVTNVSGYVRASLANEIEKRAAPSGHGGKASTAAPATAKASTAKTATARRGRNRGTAAEEAEAVRRSVAGEDHALIAADMNLNPTRVNTIRRDHERGEAHRRMRAGEDVDAILADYSHLPDGYDAVLRAQADHYRRTAAPALAVAPAIAA